MHTTINIGDIVRVPDKGVSYVLFSTQTVAYLYPLRDVVGILRPEAGGPITGHVGDSRIGLPLNSQFPPVGIDELDDAEREALRRVLLEPVPDTSGGRSRAPMKPVRPESPRGNFWVVVGARECASLRPGTQREAVWDAIHDSGDVGIQLWEIVYELTGVVKTRGDLRAHVALIISAMRGSGLVVAAKGTSGINNN